MSKKNSKKMSWTEEQNALLEKSGEHHLRYSRVAVHADAGSGKTSVLVERIKRVLDSQTFKQKILCVSFTEKSKEDLKKKLSDQPQVEVYTIHGFCKKIIDEFHPLIGLRPVFSVIDQSTADELFRECFQKIYRTAPLYLKNHGEDALSNAVLKSRFLAQTYLSKPEIKDLENPEESLVQGFFENVLQLFEEKKWSLGQLEYSDLERVALDLLEFDNVRAELFSRYGAFFVDEFQDTSEIQCRLVDLLAGNERSVFVVGDPKQSIYRFRGAQVSVFEDFSNRVGHKKNLTFNFRSHPEVIKQVNKVFEKIYEGFIPMKAGREETKENPAFGSVPRVAIVQAKTHAIAIAETARELFKKGVPYSDMVLLLRRLKGNADLIEELEHQGLNIILAGGTGNTNAQAFTLWHLWLWACFSGEKLSAAQVLFDFQREIPSIENFSLLHRDLFEQKTGPMLLVLLDQKFSLRKRFGSHYQFFSHYVLSNLKSGKSSLEIATELKKAIKTERYPSSYPHVPPPKLEALRVMTVHASKGLEFPVVFLGDLDATRTRAESFVSGQNKVYLPVRNEKGELNKSDPLLSQILEVEKAEAEEESKRLLYVAMTRAEESLYFVDALAPVPEGKKPRAPTGWKKWIIESAPEVWSHSSSLDAAPLDKKNTPSVPLSLLASDNDLFPIFEKKGSASFIAPQLFENYSLPEKQVRKSDLKHSLILADRGTMVHRFLETGDFDSLFKYAEDFSIPLSSFREWLKTETGRLVFTDSSVKRRFEVPFWLKKQDLSSSGIISGRIDLLLETPKGELWVVDFKLISSPTTPEHLIQHYRPQMEMYIEAVKKMTANANVSAFLLDLAAASGHHFLQV